jgi:16S rRNA (cytosine967-C5)-methyltransferase
LRWKGRLDYVVDSVALKKKPSGWLRKMLLIACYQLIAQDRTAAGLVVSETVSAIKSQEGELPAKFANACLRKISSQASVWRNWAFPQGGPLAEQAAWGSLPVWLWSELVQQQGLEWTQAYALASLERPTLWIRSRGECKSKLGDTGSERLQAGPIPHSWQLLPGQSLGGATFRDTLDQALQQDWIVQDISSQILVSQVTEALAALTKLRAPGQGLTVLDLCASPGGKSVGLAWNGMSVLATDRTEDRLPLLRQNVERCAPQQIRILPWDQAWKTVVTCDLIWVDAPCSSTGILRRHPDVRWLRSQKQLEALTLLQRQLLRKAWEQVMPGGFLVYSVCSVLKEEGPEVIQNEKLEGAILKTWFFAPQSQPHGDGFWAALLMRDPG